MYSVATFEILRICTYVGRAQSTVEGHGSGSEGSCPTRTTNQRFYRPMLLLMLYLVPSLSSSSFPPDRLLYTGTLIARTRLAMLLHTCPSLPSMSSILPRNPIHACTSYGSMLSNRTDMIVPMTPLPILQYMSHI